MLESAWFWTLVVLGLFLVAARRAGLNAFVLRQLDRGVVWARGGYGDCPHADCYEHVSSPMFARPGSGGRNRLLPRRGALLWSDSGPGKPLVPTLHWLGKGALKRYCGACGGALPTHNADAAHIAIYGGPSAGKTMYATAAVHVLRERGWPGATALLFPPRRDQAFRRRTLANFEAGRVEPKTAEASPAGTTVVLFEGATETPVHLYDAAGEAGASEQGLLKAHGFLDHLSGLIVTVDALSLASLRRRYEARAARSSSPVGREPVAEPPATTSSVHPEQTITRLINVLRPLYAERPRAKIALPLAIVVTKVDLADVTAALGVEPDAEDFTTPPGPTAGASESDRLRGWFKSHEPHLAGLLENHFASVRFFAASALGHAEVGRSFEPKGVLTPLAWLLARTLSKRQRLLTRARRVVAEGGIALAVLLTLVIAPLVSVGTAGYFGAAYAIEARQAAARRAALAEAWEATSKQAADHTLGRDARVAAISTFLEAYPGPHRHVPTAHQYLVDLQLGLEPVMAPLALGEFSYFHFTIDKTEVTVAAYRDCVDNGRCRASSFATHRESKQCNWGRADRNFHPMNCVDWFGARSFCAYRGKRLPTGAQWQLANNVSMLSRLRTPRRLSCHNTILNDGVTTTATSSTTEGCGRGSTWPVASRPALGLGLFDLAGNVSEWTSSYSMPGKRRAVWGGAWTDLPSQISPPSEWGVAPDTKDARIGFRCVRSP